MSETLPPALSALSVEAGADGSLDVTWAAPAGESPSQTVYLAVGPGPDPATHVPVASAPAGSGRAAIPAERTTAVRAFVSARLGDEVPPLVAADRHISFDGPVNFRDVGGYRNEAGRTVAWGRVYRSDTLNLSDADLERFGALGIRSVWDLRNTMEREATPNRLPDGDLTVHTTPLISEDPEQSPMAALNAADGKDFLRLLYLHILERSAPTVGRVVAGLADEPELPAVFHCSAGKDRTGLISGVLLSVLGVPLEVIVDDYEMTGRYRTTEHVQATIDRLGRTQNLAPEVVAGMLEAPRPAMELALAEVGERYGGFDRYLTGPAGAPADLPDRLREALLTD